ncbi:hypothetical protein [Streptomyces iakyrus]|uniref:hypothetical protein n=1 Tax=Streptomyces iakyrus TaxID=68219 RepID=UPI0036F835F3
MGLTDFWKQQALLNAAGMLRPGGSFYLWDVIFGFEPSSAETHRQQWIDTAGRPDGGGFSMADFEAHVRDEFSTCIWIVEGICIELGSTSSPGPFPVPLMQGSAAAGGSRSHQAFFGRSETEAATDAGAWVCGARRAWVVRS